MYQQLQHFFAMGGYGTYIWSAYGITITILIMNIIQPLLHHRQLLKQKLNHSSYNQSRSTHVTSS